MMKSAVSTVCLPLEKRRRPHSEYRGIAVLPVDDVDVENVFG